MQFLRYALMIFIFSFLFFPGFGEAAGLRDVAINEIAWSGTRASSADEWIELKNNTNAAIDLVGWGVYEQRGDVLIVSLEGVIQPASFYLIERGNDDNAVVDVVASQPPKPFGGYGLSNSGEYLILKDVVGNVIDSVNASNGWFSGSASSDYFSMERINSLASGDDAANWKSNDGATRNGKDAEGNPINGTPLAVNSEGSGTSDQSGDSDNLPPSNGESSSSGGSSIPPAANNPPKANAGDDIFTFFGETIQFNASKSSDADGDTLSFSWNLGNGEIIKEKIFGYIYQFPGKYIVTLTISDGTSESSDEIIVDVVSGGVKISEFLPSPKGSDVEGEWIEIYNSSDYLADLGGWQMDDIADGGSKSWTFPARTFIQPGGYLVISREISNIALNNDKDAVRLIYSNGLVADEIVYEKAKEGVSGIFMAGNFYWSKFPTPGMPNILEAEVVKTISGKPINSYFVEDFGGTYQSVIFSGNAADKTNETGRANKNLVIVGNEETESGALKEVFLGGEAGKSGLAGLTTGQASNKFVSSKNMLQASAGGVVSIQSLVAVILISLGAGAAGLYLFFQKIRKRNIAAQEKQSWDILVDE